MTADPIPTCLGAESGSGAGTSGANDTVLNEIPPSSYTDQLVNTTLRDVAQAYGFTPQKLPGLRYAHGRRENEAWVDPRSYVQNTLHTVILGAPRIEREATCDVHYGTIGLAVVIAHEMAHIHQYYTNLVSRVQAQTKHYIRALELHADYLAGWYLGRDSDWTENAFGVADDRVASWADACVESAQHHGFPSERRYALRSGWLAARLHSPPFVPMSRKALGDVLETTTLPSGTSVCKR
jgi:hypothetical protein